MNFFQIHVTLSNLNSSNERNEMSKLGGNRNDEKKGYDAELYVGFTSIGCCAVSRSSIDFN